MTHAKTIIGVGFACTLLWLGLGIPLALALVIHLVIARALQRPGPELTPLAPPASQKFPWDGMTRFALVLISVLYFLFLTRGTGAILGVDMLSGSFDSLALALLRGSSEIDPSTIRWEAFVVDGRSYMYFGPWPAILRIPAQWLAPDLFGQWARLSCFVASMLCVGAFSLMSARMLDRNDALESNERRFILTTSIVGFGLATPLLFLTNAASIYHESILWGLAGSLCFCAVLVPRFDDPASLVSRLPLLATLAGATFLARVTYGAPLFAILLLIAAYAVRSGSLERGEGAPPLARAMGRLFVALLPAGVMLLFHLWYNFDRYGSPLTFVDYRLMGFMNADPTTLAILDETGVFNLRRVLTAIGNYVVPSPEMLSGQFPWFRIARPSYPDAGLYPRIFTSQVMALPIMASWLVVGGVVGAFGLFRERGTGFARLCFGAFVLQALLICSYYIMELRYEIDVIPMLVVGYGVFLSRITSRGVLRGRARDVATVLLFAVAMSTVVATSGTLSAIALGGPAHPPEYKEQWEQRFRAIDELLPGR